ncbi:hypothetical protein [Falsibacillus albus]|nr:hypothetical protein [Falsibacillus albus]
MKKFESHGIGFLSTLILSLILLGVLISWFQTASLKLYIGTIPWFFDQAAAFVSFLVYLIAAWILLKKLNKQVKEA